MIFKDRNDAALRLIQRLSKYKDESCIVFAVPRGGVPVGYRIAKHFGFPLELILTKKIGHPYNRELAIGAVSLEGMVMDSYQGIPDEYIQDQLRKIRTSLKERYKMFMGDREALDVKGRVVILVDDGIATGNTILASIELIRRRGPRKIVVAVPVSPTEAAERIRDCTDDFICLYIPEYFMGVGQFYEDFSQVTDEEVINLLKEVDRSGHII